MKTAEEFKTRWPEMFDGTDRGGNFYCPAGWTDLVWNLCENIEQEFEGDLDDFNVVQVKEKFGGLRFYVSTKGKVHEAKDEVLKLIAAAENESFNVCLSCGTTEGVTTGVTGASRGWVSSQCGDCRDKPRVPRKAE